MSNLPFLIIAKHVHVLVLVGVCLNNKNFFCVYILYICTIFISLITSLILQIRFRKVISAEKTNGKIGKTNNSSKAVFSTVAVSEKDPNALSSSVLLSYCHLEVVLQLCQVIVMKVFQWSAQEKLN